MDFRSKKGIADPVLSVLLDLTLFMCFFRVLLVREVSQDLLELLDSKDFQDPKVPLVRVASLESRYKLRLE